MMIDRPPKQIGVRELRDRLTKVIDQVQQGEPFVVLNNNSPIAVLLPHDEILTWRRVEFSMASLHGLEIYPEAARGTYELARIVRGERRITHDEMESLLDEPHQILLEGTTIGISQARVKMAGLLHGVPRGENVTVLVGGQFVVEVISPREHQRLQRLHRIVAWFQAAGLDLTTADVHQVIRWVREFRVRPGPDAHEGSATA